MGGNRRNFYHHISYMLRYIRCYVLDYTDNSSEKDMKDSN